jgi:hypothetical protein
MPGTKVPFCQNEVRLRGLQKGLAREGGLCFGSAGYSPADFI